MLFRSLGMPVARSNEAWLWIEADVEDLDEELVVGYAIYAEDGMPVFTSYPTDGLDSTWPPASTGKIVLTTRLPLELLNQGRFRVELVAFIRLREWLFQPGKNAPFVYFEATGPAGDAPEVGIPRLGPLAPVLPWRVGA